jgi:hypothetical protein
MKKLCISLLGLLALLACYSPPSVQAECRVLTSPETYTAGQVVRDVCDIHGTRTTIGADSSGTVTGTVGGQATAASPTLVEAAYYGFSLDLSGNLRTTQGTLLSGEDQTNNLIATSGGAVRQTIVASAITTNTTSTANIVPVGKKTFYGQVVCSSGACVQTQAIYGDIDSDAANGVLLCTLTLSATTRDQAVCVIDASHSFYYVVTTATSGTAATGAIYAMY